MSHARMTGTNLSVRMRVSAMEPSSRSVNSRWSVLSLWVSPLTTSTRPVLERTTPEIAPAARARARCQWDKARAGGRSDCCAAPRCVSCDGQRPCSRPTSSASRPSAPASRPSAPASRPSAPASRPSPSTSRPSSSPSRPTASPSRPNSSGTRPGTTPSRPNLPNGGTRPSVPGSGSIGSGASRPNLDAGKVGSGGRPSQSQLQNFLDLPASGGSSNRPGAATRPADGVRPMPANNAASDFLQNRGPQTGQLPGLADRTDLPGRAETRPASGENRLGNVDRVDPANRQD